jgi:hypothetical protein
VCCHFAVRSMMTDAARHAALRITQRTIAHAGDFPLASQNTMAKASRRTAPASCFDSTIPTSMLRTPGHQTKDAKWHVKPAHHAT